MGAGLLEANRTGGTVKRVHCGWAARCGVAAADLARHGLTGPPTVLSDEELARGFHDNAARSLPEERAAELATRTLAFLTLRASRISPRR
jgi:2-methylcitrate dehydratase PrpD